MERATRTPQTPPPALKQLDLAVTPSSVALSPSPTSTPSPAPLPSTCDKLMEIFAETYPASAANRDNCTLVEEGVQHLRNRVTKWSGETGELKVVLHNGILTVHYLGWQVEGAECTVHHALKLGQGGMVDRVMVKETKPGCEVRVARGLKMHREVAKRVPEEFIAAQGTPISGGVEQTPYCGDAVDRRPNTHSEILDYALTTVHRSCQIIEAFQSAEVVHGDFRLENLFMREDGVLVAADFSDTTLNSTSQTDVIYTLINLHRIIEGIDPRGLTTAERPYYYALVGYMNEFVEYLKEQAKTNRSEIASLLRQFKSQGIELTQPPPIQYLVAKHFPGSKYTPKGVMSELDALAGTETPATLDPLPTLHDLFPPRPPAVFHPPCTVTSQVWTLKGPDGAPAPIGPLRSIAASPLSADATLEQILDAQDIDITRALRAAAPT